MSEDDVRIICRYGLPPEKYSTALEHQLAHLPPQKAKQIFGSHAFFLNF